MAAKLAKAFAIDEGFSCQCPEITAANSAAGGTVIERTNTTNSSTSAPNFARKMSRALTGKPGQRQAVAQPGEQRLPLEDSEQRGDGHGHGDEDEQVFAHALAVKLRGGEVGRLEEIVAPPVGAQAERAHREQRREKPDGYLLPFARARRPFRCRRSARGSGAPVRSRAGGSPPASRSRAVIPPPRPGCGGPPRPRLRCG